MNDTSSPPTAAMTSTKTISLSEELNRKYQRLLALIGESRRAIVAYSGGVDSGFLLFAAQEALGSEGVLACLGISESLARDQYAFALKLAEELGGRVRELKLGELADPNYQANHSDRCFHCKTHLYEACLKTAEAEGYEAVLCGSNVDDTGDYRPGMAAAEKLGVRSPLIEAGLTKADIRQLCRHFKLSIAERPASPCLASRVPYGLSITPERLDQVDRAEALLRQEGFEEFRVRHHETVARIELKEGDMGRLLEGERRARVIEGFKQIGFAYIALDLEGFRSGSLNETLDQEKGY